MRIKETVYHIEAPLHLTIALLSDTHNTEPTPILYSLKAHRPDLICIAGDLLLGHRPEDDSLIVRSQENVLRLVSGCVGVAPCYISLGNHEWMISSEDLEILTSTGAVILDNRFVVQMVRDGEKIIVGGLTSAIASYFQTLQRIEDGGTEGRYPHRPSHFHSERLNTESAWLDEFENVEGYKVLLCHHPEYWNLREPNLINHKIDLILSGHAHGGQMRVFGQGLFSPGQGWFPKYTSGVYQGEYGSLVVSRGLSNTASPIPRLFNPTEIVYLELGV